MLDDPKAITESLPLVESVLVEPLPALQAPLPAVEPPSRFAVSGPAGKAPTRL